MADKTTDHMASIHKAKELIIRSKLYRIVAYVMGLAGFVISATLYQKMGHGDPLYVMQNPLLILVFLLPFVPTVFLAMLSSRKRAKATGILRPLYPEAVRKELDELGEEY